MLSAMIVFLLFIVEMKTASLIRLFLFITKANDEWIYIKLESAVPGTTV